MALAPKSAASAGFTLLELLVALLLTALLTVVAFASLNISLKAWRQGQSEAERLQEVRVGENILERSLSSAVRGSLGEKIYFKGDSKQMRFFTLLPLEAHSLGGVYHWRVFLAEDEANQGVLAVEQTKNVNWQRDRDGVEIRQFIVKQVTSLSFAYGRGREEFNTWDAKRQERLPDWVRVTLTLTGQAEPQTWLIPFRVSPYEKLPQTTQVVQ